MPTAFRLIDDGTTRHYADIPLARAWLAVAVAASDERAEARLDAQTPAAQLAATQQAWGALGNAFRAMDLRATAVPAYVVAMQAAYGAGPIVRSDYAPDRVLLAPNDGALLQVAATLYRAAGGGAVTADAWTPVRIRLDDRDAVVTACAAVPDATCSRGFPDRRDYSGAPCMYAPNDHRCGGVDFTGAGARAVLVPLVYSLRIARDVAGSVLRDGIASTIRMTLATTPDASLVLGDAAPDAAYEASFPEPEGFTRMTMADGSLYTDAPGLTGGVVPPVLHAPRGGLGNFDASGFTDLSGGGGGASGGGVTPGTSGGGVTPAACTPPAAGTLTTRDQIIAWNYTHTGCPPLPVPAAPTVAADVTTPGGEAPNWTVPLLVVGGLAVAGLLLWQVSAASAKPPAAPAARRRTR